MRKKLRLLGIFSVMTVFCLIISGCANIQADFTFNKDGSITSQHIIEISSMIDKDNLETQKAADSKNGYEVKEISNGYTATKTVASIHPIVGGTPVFNPNEYFNGVQVHKGLLYDYYSFDLFKKGEKADIPKANYQTNIPGFFSPDVTMNIWQYMDYRRQAEEQTRQMNQMADQATKAAVDSMKINITFNLPYSVDDSNADIKTNDNKTLTWDLKPAFLNNQDISIQAKFKIYHENTIIALLISGIFLLIIAVVLFVLGLIKWQDHKKRNLFLSLTAILLIIVAGSAAWCKRSIDNPPQLTMADRIVSETAKDSDGKPLLDTLRNTQEIPLNSLDTAQKTLFSKGSNAEITAVSSTDEDGFLALGTLDSKLYFIIYDAKDGSTALVPYNPNVLNYREHFISFNDGKKHYDPMIFLLQVSEKNNSKDKILGVWDGARHTIPIYVVFKLGDDGRVIPGMITSGQGLKPSHYQAALQEPKNVELVNIVPTHINSLRADIKGRNIILPNK
ncbi:hypothetical protein [Pectinatus haikarae]|uniref:Uncharacterized protein n=1 Tax=Pectinatus haikarae TaxID=349096 RepID=A0ABT9Y4V3_9FIRM|nr:hypothetical protein [Pectinatus haikarae]MDQ0202855.1 hypothetical protein [Pectinatus haikarae]